MENSNIDHIFTPDEGGLVLVDKPLTWTSHDVVRKIRGAMRSVVQRRNFKVGHAGTLDPLASGLLILAYGPFTKKLPFITAEMKVYTGTITLGSTTPSFDLETVPEPAGEWEHLGEAEIREAFSGFMGEVMQRPPLYSAKRHEGERGYFLARSGSQIEMPAVKVLIERLDLIAVRGAEIDFEVHVSKGTYIRSLAHDIGQVLGCGAHLSALRRTAIGEYRVEDAWGPLEWSQHIAPMDVR
jgi:tRNA pseudouridine55 synthase